MEKVLWVSWFYGSAEFMGVPWETVIKMFRKHHSGPHMYLKDYGEDFLRFLTSDKLLSDDHINSAFINFIQGTVRELRGIIDNNVKEKKCLPEDEAHEILRNVTALPKMDWATVTNTQEILSKFDVQFETVINDSFKGLTIDKHVIKQICVSFSQLKVSQQHPEMAGLVIAGFGEVELYPGIWNCRVKSVVPTRHLQVDINSSTSVGPGIMPFGQIEVVDGFMTGIDTQIRSMVNESLGSLLKKVSDHHLSQQIQTVPEEQLANLKASAQAAIDQVVGSFQTKFDAHILEKHIGPVLGAVGFFAKR